MVNQVAPTAERNKGVVELTIAMVLSGTIGVFVVESGAEPFTVAFFRCVFGAAALALYCWIRGYFKQTGFTRKTFLIAVLGGVFIVYNWAFLFAAYEKTSISLATIVYHTQPFYVLLIGSVVFKEKLTVRKLGWVVLAFVGVVLVTNPTRTSGGSDYLLGVGQALLAALFYAFATIIAKQLKGLRPHLIALIQVIVGIPLLLPFVSFAGTGSLGAGWAWLIGIGIIHTCVMYILLYSSYQKLPTSLIAVLSFVYPVVAIVVDMTVYGTRIHPIQVVGILLICGASLANSLNWQPRKPKPDDVGDTAMEQASR